VRTKLGLRAAAIAFAALAAAGTARAQDSSNVGGYHVTRRYTLGAEGGWDYIIADAAHGHLYVSRGTHVMVVSLQDGSVVGDIPNTPGVHGIAFEHENHHGFTSNGRDTSVTIFDLRTLATISNVKVTGANPDAIIYDAASHRVFTMNGRGANSTAIDVTNGTVAGTVPLNGRPEFAVADGRGSIFVNIEDSNAVVRFNARTLQVEARWSIAPCDGPSGLAIDREHHRLFSVCDGVMAISDADNNRMITTVPIGRGPDAAAFDPATQNVFASCGGSGTLTIVHEDSPDHFTLVGNLATERGARTMTLDEQSHKIFLPTADFQPAPAPTPGQRPQRPQMVPGTFRLVVVER
jgi:DNA-binding beta-propeller fold protein YncE